MSVRGVKTLVIQDQPWHSAKNKLVMKRVRQGNFALELAFYKGRPHESSHDRTYNAQRGHSMTMWLRGNEFVLFLLTYLPLSGHF